MTIYFDRKANKRQLENGADWLYVFLNSSQISKTYSIVGLRPFDVAPFTRDLRNPRKDPIGLLLARRNYDHGDFKVLEVSARPGELDVTARAATEAEAASLDRGSWIRLTGHQSLVYGVHRMNHREVPYLDLTLMVWDDGPSKDFLHLCVCSAEQIPERWAWIEYEYDLAGRIYNRYMSGRRLTAAPRNSIWDEAPKKPGGPRFYCEYARPNGPYPLRLAKVKDKAGLEALKQLAAEDPLAFALRWLPLEDAPWREDCSVLTGVPNFNLGCRMGDQDLFRVDLTRLIPSPGAYHGLPPEEIVEWMRGLLENGDISLADLEKTISEGRFSRLHADALIENLMPIVMA